MLTRTEVLGVLTIAGREQCVSQARAFVSDVLGAGHPCIDVACLLASELVTNAVRHSRSRRPGGTVTVVVADGGGGGVRVDVIDDGATLTTPAIVRDGALLAAGGRGLVLVDALADEWGHACHPGSTTVWFSVSA